MGTIASGARAWYQSGDDRWNSANVVFEHDGRLYAVLQDDGASASVRVYRSNSLTDLTFSEMDAGNAPAVATTNEPFPAHQHANGHLNVASYRLSNTPEHSLFDVSTGQWAAGYGDFVANLFDGQLPWHMTQRSDDTLVLYGSFVSDDADIIADKLTSAGANTGGGVGVASLTSAEASQVVFAWTDLGADRTYVVYVDVAGDDITYESYVGTTQSTPVDINASGPASEDTHVLGSFRPWLNGVSYVTVAYLDANQDLRANDIQLDGAATSGGVGALQLVDTTPGNVEPHHVVATAAFDGQIWLAAYDDANNGSLYLYTRTSGTWSGRSLIGSKDSGFLAATGDASPLQIVPTSNDGLLLVYQDGSDVRWHWLVAPPMPVTVMAEAMACGGVVVDLTVKQDRKVFAELTPAAALLADPAVRVDRKVFPGSGAAVATLLVSSVKVDRKVLADGMTAQSLVFEPAVKIDRKVLADPVSGDVAGIGPRARLSVLPFGSQATGAGVSPGLSTAVLENLVLAGSDINDVSLKVDTIVALAMTGGAVAIEPGAGLTVDALVAAGAASQLEPVIGLAALVPVATATALRNDALVLVDRKVDAELMKVSGTGFAPELTVTLWVDKGTGTAAAMEPHLAARMMADLEAASASASVPAVSTTATAELADVDGQSIDVAAKVDRKVFAALLAAAAEQNAPREESTVDAGYLLTNGSAVAPSVESAVSPATVSGDVAALTPESEIRLEAQWSGTGEMLTLTVKRDSKVLAELLEAAGVMVAPSNGATVLAACGAADSEALAVTVKLDSTGVAAVLAAVA
ncbi:MAG: hypothetical protein AB7G88_12940, partial [Thermomicrobiales bacterium]